MVSSICLIVAAAILASVAACVRMELGNSQFPEHRHPFYGFYGT